MNVRNDVTITSPNNKDELCAEFVIDDATIPFLLNSVVQTGENYVLSFWMRSNSNALLRVGETEVLISTEWKRYKFSFTAKEENVKIYFLNAQKYFLYRAQLETGTVMTDWAPSPDDVKASLEVKIDTENLISEINASADIIRLTGDRIVIDSTYFKVEEDGTVIASNMTITGTSQFISEQSEDSEDYTGSRVVIENGIIRTYDNQDRMVSISGSGSYYGGSEYENYYSKQEAKGLYIRDLNDELLCSMTNTGIFGAKNTKLNWEGQAEFKELNVNGYPVYGDKLVSFKTTPYSGETGRTISINKSMSKCQKGTGHVCINEQYYVELTSSGVVSAGELLQLGVIPDMYIPDTRVAVSVYANYSKPYIFTGNVSTEGIVEVRPNVELPSGSYYIAVSANYLLKASEIQDASFAITEQPESKVVDVGASVTFRLETDLEGNDTNTQFVWQTSSDNGKTWSNVKVHTPMANYSEYSISSVTDSQDGLMVRCTINRGDETVVSDIAILSTTKEEYRVSYNLTNCTSSNNATTVIEGESYETTIQFNEGYESGSGTVTMNSSNITSSALSGNKISISKVTGDISITYNASKIESGGGDTGGDTEVTPLEITTHPQDASAEPGTGTNVFFTVEANGDDLTFQWQISEDYGSSWENVSLGTGTSAHYRITEETDTKSTLRVKSVTINDHLDMFRCVITDKHGNKVTSNEATLTATTTEPEVSYTNLVPTSKDSSGSIFNGKGYKENYRLSSSGGESQLTGAVVSGFIPYNGEIIRAWGSTVSTAATTGNYIGFYDASYNKLHVVSGTMDGVVYESHNGKYMMTCTKTSLTSSVQSLIANAKFIRCSFGACSDPTAFVVTLNEEIT